MENLLKVNIKAYNKVYTFYYIILIINIILFGLITFNYCQSYYFFSYMEEKDPDIDLTGLKSFYFEKSLNKYEYSPEMSNLGNTGSIYLDCYLGECTYEEFDTCTDDNGREYSCSSYYSIEEHFCSDVCRQSKDKSCSYACYEGYDHFYKSSCYRYDNYDNFLTPKSCNADNLILNWKNYNYIRINATDYGNYTYLNSAVPFNESCPEGKKMCGILDNLGNKLCYPLFEICPINFITFNESEIKNFSFYNSTKIKDKILYYTNRLRETGKVLGGLFVDSDLMIKYNDEDCETIDTGLISELLQHNYNKLYRNTLNFDPYLEEKDQLDKRGISYLKACVPGHGKEKNITKIKELLIEYNINKTNNENYMKPIKTLFIISYFISLPGYIVSFIFLSLLIFSFYKQNDIETKFEIFGLNENKNKLLIMIFIISYFFIISGSILSLLNNIYNLLDAIDINYCTNIIISLIIINYITFILSIIIILFIIAFLIYLYKSPLIGSDNIDSNKRNLIDKPVNNVSSKVTNK